MKLSPRPNDIVSIYENPEPEPEPEPEEPGGLEERVVQLESKIETLLRRFHELSSGL